jgi:hypothetical protein
VILKTQASQSMASSWVSKIIPGLQDASALFVLTDCIMYINLPASSLFPHCNTQLRVSILKSQFGDLMRRVGTRIHGVLCDSLSFPSRKKLGRALCFVVYINLFAPSFFSFFHHTNLSFSESVYLYLKWSVLSENK